MLSRSKSCNQQWAHLVLDKELLAKRRVSKVDKEEVFHRLTLIRSMGAADVFATA